jgi:hypothetical protein
MESSDEEAMTIDEYIKLYENERNTKLNGLMNLAILHDLLPIEF